MQAAHLSNGLPSEKVICLALRAFLAMAMPFRFRSGIAVWTEIRFLPDMRPRLARFADKLLFV